MWQQLPVDKKFRAHFQSVSRRFQKAAKNWPGKAYKTSLHLQNPFSFIHWSILYAKLVAGSEKILGEKRFSCFAFLKQNCWFFETNTRHLLKRCFYIYKIGNAVCYSMCLVKVFLLLFYWLERWPSKMGVG